MGSTTPSKPTVPPSRMPRITAPVSFYGLSVYRVFYMQAVCVFFFLTLFARPLGVTAQEGSGPNTNVIDGCVDSYNPATDYFPEKIQVENATLFSIEYRKNYKILTNKNTKETFALIQCGTPPPDGLSSDTKVFQVPVRNVTVLDSTSSAFLELLGVRDKIKYVELGSNHISPCIQKRLEEGAIGTLSTAKSQRTQQINSTDVVLGAFMADPNEITVSTSAPNDDGPLQRLEWLEFYAAFFNLDGKGENITNGINANYECRRGAIADDADNKPLVVWAAYIAPDETNNNTESWNIYGDVDYKRKFVEDAGGSFLAPKTSVFSSSADFLNTVKDVDVLIDETYVAPGLKEVLANYGLPNDINNSEYKFVRNRRIFRLDGIVNGDGMFDWFDRAFVMPDAVLEDLSNSIDPSLPRKDYKRIWFRNVAENEDPAVVSGRNCTDVNAPLESLAPHCDAGSVDNNNNNDNGGGNGDNGANNAGVRIGTIHPIVLAALAALAVLVI